MNTLKVQRRKIANVYNGEPWVYPNAVLSTDVEAGLVRVVTNDDDFVGIADYNPDAPIRARILSFEDSWQGDHAWLEQHLVAAIERRLRLGYSLQAGACRLVNGEGDGMPGLVVDCYGTTLVIDFYTKGMLERKHHLELFFNDKLSDMNVIYRMGEDAAKRENIAPLPPISDSNVTFCEQAVRFEIDFSASQKTGFYLDQRENRRLLAMYGRGRKVLDLFSYHGGFSLAALANGAESALAVDSSNQALEAASRNAVANGLQLDVLPADVFDAFDTIKSEGPFDFIVCDPPKLAPSKRDRNKALGAYRYLVDKCLQNLAPKGIMLLASCSQAIDHEDLRKLLTQQAKKQRLTLDVIAQTSQPADHPWPVSFTVGRYLSAIFVERR